VNYYTIAWKRLKIKIEIVGAIKKLRGIQVPIIDFDLGLMIPLGNRWKSYSLSPTTTVCPALFPPYRKVQTSRTS